MGQFGSYALAGNKPAELPTVLMSIDDLALCIVDDPEALQHLVHTSGYMSLIFKKITRSHQILWEHEGNLYKFKTRS